jgi:hypothetical protein
MALFRNHRDILTAVLASYKFVRSARFGDQEQWSAPVLGRSNIRPAQARWNYIQPAPIVRLLRPRTGALHCPAIQAPRIS